MVILTFYSNLTWIILQANSVDFDQMQRSAVSDPGLTVCFCPTKWTLVLWVTIVNLRKPPGYIILFD